MCRDTDSTFVKFPGPVDDLAHHWRLGGQAADAAAKLFKPPHSLELEKLLSPFILAAKKRYTGLQYEDITKPPKLIFKGIQVTRRDSCKFVKDTLTEAVNLIMYQKSVDAAVSYVQAQTSRLLKGEVPMNDLIMSKTYRTGLVTENHPHVQVVKKMQERAPGSEPRSGDRVPFVYVQQPYGAKNMLSCHQAEDPIYAKEHKLKIDVVYYKEHALMNPIISLFELLMSDPRARIFGSRDIQTATNEVQNLAKKQRSIRSFMSLGRIDISDDGPRKQYMLT